MKCCLCMEKCGGDYACALYKYSMCMCMCACQGGSALCRLHPDVDQVAWLACSGIKQPRWRRWSGTCWKCSRCHYHVTVSRQVRPHYLPNSLRASWLFVIECTCCCSVTDNLQQLLTTLQFQLIIGKLWICCGECVELEKKKFDLHFVYLSILYNYNSISFFVLHLWRRQWVTNTGLWRFSNQIGWADVYNSRIWMKVYASPNYTTDTPTDFDVLLHCKCQVPCHWLPTVESVARCAYCAYRGIVFYWASTTVPSATFVCLCVCVCDAAVD